MIGAAGVQAPALEPGQRAVLPAVRSRRPCQQRLGVEHGAHLLGVVRPVGGQPPHARPEPARVAASVRERRRAPAGACGAASWATGRGRTSRARAIAPGANRCRIDHTASTEISRTLSTPACSSRHSVSATPGRQTSKRQHVVRRARGRQRDGGLAHARADLDDQRRLAAEPRPDRSKPGSSTASSGIHHASRAPRPTPACWRALNRLPRREYDSTSRTRCPSSVQPVRAAAPAGSRHAIVTSSRASGTVESCLRHRSDRSTGRRRPHGTAPWTPREPRGRLLALRSSGLARELDSATSERGPRKPLAAAGPSEVTW